MKPILDKKIVEKIVISIPQKYDAIATAIEQTKRFGYIISNH